MSVYTVYEPPGASGTKNERADKLEFVRDALSRPTLVFGPFWMLVTKQWASLVAYAFAAVFFAGLSALIGLPAAVWGYFYFGLNLIFALEQPLIHAAYLESQGWQHLGVSEGSTEEDAIYRFLSEWLSEDDDTDGDEGANKAISIALSDSDHSAMMPALKDTRSPRILN